MARDSIRTTLTLPADLVKAADRAVHDGKACSLNELVARALRHELAAQERAVIYSAFAGMTDDPEHHTEARAIDAEFAHAGWEALQQAEQDLPGQP